MSSIPVHQNGAEPSDRDNEERLPYVPILHDVCGETEADRVAHVQARVTLLSLLLHDENVSTCFDRWGEITNLGPCAVRAVELTETLARAAGFDGRADLYEDGLDTLEFQVESEAEKQRLRQLVRDSYDALDEFSDCLSNLGRSLARQATTLVRDNWQLPWPWLSVELVHAYIRSMTGFVFGQRLFVTYWYELPPPPLERPMPDAPLHFSFLFEPHSGESIQEAMQRAADEAATQLVNAFEDVAAPDDDCRPLPLGRLPDPDQVSRDVTWWYRVHLRGESKRSLAKEHNPFALNPPTKTIRDALNRAEYWLSASPWEWKSQEPSAE